jgi:hypothetical protein
MPQKPTQKKPRFKSNICKPCWELRYCPYGPLVEFFPLSPETTSVRRIRRIYKEVLAGFAAGENKTEHEIWSEVDRLLYARPGNWEYIKQFQTAELACNVFGHICPVFLASEGATETREGRSFSRNIPRDVMLKVIRRDGQVCQKCHKAVPDNEVEFDHLIPFSRGGPIAADNIRLLCRACNRGKGDSLTEILTDPKQPFVPMRRRRPTGVIVIEPAPAPKKRGRRATRKRSH